MAGQRASKDTPIPFAPGVISNLTDRDATNRYKDSNRVRWHKGLAEKLGGWVRQAFGGANGGVYIGVARGLHDWSSLDTQQWIAIGTHCKLYLVNNATLHDITPLRKAGNTVASLSVTSGSPTITINDPDHRARTGDHIRLYATAPIGGFTVEGVYDITSIPTPDSITVTFTSNFNATEAGGGSVTVEYDITCGLPENGELRGYGTGLYGAGTFGTPRPVGSGVPARMRTWSLDNWGEDLLAAPSDGELYWWDRTTGPASRAARVNEAPTDIQRMLVNGKVGHVILLGCSNLDGTPDPMRFRWCAQGNFTIWDPTLSRTAGGGRFDKGSRLITGIVSRATNYVWSDTFMYSLQYVGTPDIFLPSDIGTCKIVGPNAAVDRNGVVEFMAFDDFYIYDGTLRVLICEMHTKIFGDENRNIEGLFDRTQAEAVYAVTYSAKNEVTWFYPCTDGLIRYVTHNHVLDCWYGGTMERTAYRDVSEAITGYKTNPYGVNGGYLYKHEVGKDEVEGAVTTPQAWFLETYDINAGGSDAVMLWNFIVPNFDRLSGSMRVLLKKKSKPRQPTYQIRGPYTISESTLELGVRCKASQIAMRFESAGVAGDDWRMGIFQVNATPYGGRMGAHIEADPVAPSAPILSGDVIDDETNHLTWTTATAGDSPIAGYRLYNADTDELIFDSLSPSVLTYDHFDRAPGIYRYYVIAYATDGQTSQASNTVTLKVGGDPFFADVMVLLTANTGALVEWTGRPTITVQGGGAVSSTQVKFGVASFRNPAPQDTFNTNYVVVEDTNDGQNLFAFSGELTAEGWFYMEGLNNSFAGTSLFSNNLVFTAIGALQAGIRIGIPYTLFANVRADNFPTYPSESLIGSNDGPVTIGNWFFFALTRDSSGVFRLFWNGILVATSLAVVGVIGGQVPKTRLNVAYGPASNLADANCYFDQIRVTKRCRYVADFAPPTLPFPIF